MSNTPSPAAALSGLRGGQPLRIGVAGAGAIGCTVAATLAHAGQPVQVLARGATLDAIRRNGIQLTRGDGAISAQVDASSDAAALGAQDILFLCAKAQDLSGLLAAARPMIGPKTCVLPLVNGVPWWYFQRLPGRLSGRAIDAVDPGGQLLEAVDSHQVLGSVVFITAERTAPGVVTSINPLLLIIGELDHTTSPRLVEVAQALNDAGLPTRASPQIRDPLWTKIIANLSSNPLSVLTGATLDALYSDPRVLPVARKILYEGLALASAYGARMEFDPPTFLAQAAEMGPVRTSMLQDALHGHPLELAAIGDAVLELARLQDVPMPTTQDILGLTHYRNTALHGGAAHASTGDAR